MAHFHIQPDEKSQVHFRNLWKNSLISLRQEMLSQPSAFFAPNIFKHSFDCLQGR